MAEKVLMTALSPTMEEGVIQSWTKKEGDAVSNGDVICEVETDKASMEYESIQDGILLKILVETGNSAKVGNPIAILGKKGEDISEVLASLETETVSAGATSKSSGSAGPDGTPPAASSVPAQTSTGGRIIASPLAKHIAKSKNIDLASIQGSGPGGRIVKKDVEAATKASSAGAASVASSSASYLPAQDTVVPVSGVRAIIAQRLSESKFSAPHYYLKLEVNMAPIIAARNLLNANASTKVGMNAFFIKFVAEALKRYPGVNASWEGDAIRNFASADIGLAVDRGKGLITPVVRHCESKGIVSIDEELRVLIQKAGENKLAPEEYSNATFTISNLGSFGIDEFTAIINPPGSAILALGTTKKVPVVGKDDSIKIEQRMKMSLSCDHRVIDGAAGARFFSELRDMMENPVRVLF